MSASEVILGQTRAIKVDWKYRLGDLLAGLVVGSVVALAHHFLVSESLGQRFRSGAGFEGNLSRA